MSQNHFISQSHIMKHHQEEHIYSSKNIRDIIIGLADGLTVPFALAAGLSGVIDDNSLITITGLAEIAAGSIAMGLGGYLSARSESDHYKSELAREKMEIEVYPEIELKEVRDILVDFGMPESKAPALANAIAKDPKKWVEFMMKFELGLDEPEANRLILTPLLISSSYIFGGLIPLVPYMIFSDIPSALHASCIVTMIFLTIFGALKGHFTGISKMKSAVSTALIGGTAAFAAYSIASALS